MFDDMNEVFNNVLDGFSMVVMTIIGFYFGSKGASEVVPIWKNKGTPSVYLIDASMHKYC